jgi:hypothetical protein
MPRTMRRITLGQPFPPAADNPIFDGPVHMREHFADRDELGKAQRRRGDLPNTGAHPLALTRW